MDEKDLQEKLEQERLKGVYAKIDANYTIVTGKIDSNHSLIMEKLEKIFGKDIYVTEILAKERATSSMKDELGGYFPEINHAATRVVLPNGQKYILDYWEGIQNEKPAVYTEEDWIKKQKSNLDYRDCGVIIDYTPDPTHDQDALKDYIEKHGEEEGKKRYFNNWT